MSNDGELLDECYGYSGYANHCRQNKCAFFEERGGHYTMCLPYCRKYYNRMYSGNQLASLLPSTLSFCEEMCLDHSDCMSFTWNKNSTRCILHSINTHPSYSRDMVAGTCWDDGFRPSSSPTTSYPTPSPTTYVPTSFLVDSMIVSTYDLVETGENNDYFVILSIILMILLAIIGVVFYCLYQRNCVEKQLDRISIEFRKRDPKSRRHVKEEPEDDKDYRKREIEFYAANADEIRAAQAASFRDYLDEQITEIKDQLHEAKKTTTQSQDRFERIKQQISERFVSLLADASDGFPKESASGKRRLNKKRKHRATADRYARKSGHSKKRSMTNNDRKIINIMHPSESPCESHGGDEQYVQRLSAAEEKIQVEDDNDGGGMNLGTKVPLTTPHVRHTINIGDQLKGGDIDFGGLYEHNQQDVEESHSSDDLDVITPPSTIPENEKGIPQVNQLNFDSSQDKLRHDYMLNLNLME